jgi:hypothetical protein
MGLEPIQVAAKLKAVLPSFSCSMMYGRYGGGRQANGLGTKFIK